MEKEGEAIAAIRKPLKIRLTHPRHEREHDRSIGIVSRVTGLKRLFDSATNMPAAHGVCRMFGWDVPDQTDLTNVNPRIRPIFHLVYGMNLRSWITRASPAVLFQEMSQNVVGNWLTQDHDKRQAAARAKLERKRLKKERRRARRARRA